MASRRMPSDSQRSTVISVAWRHYVTRTKSILRTKTRTLCVYKRTLISSKMNSRRSCSSGTLNMVRSTCGPHPCSWKLNISAGELRTMFAQNAGIYLDHYFREHPHPSISWIHDLGNARYDEASRSLLIDAENANELISKHVSGFSMPLLHLQLNTLPTADA